MQTRHPQSITDELERMDNRRERLLAMSRDVCAVEAMVDDLLDGAIVYVHSVMGIWITLRDAASYSDAAPLLREMRKCGWKLETAHLNDGSRFQTTDSGFSWWLTKTMPDGTLVDARLELELQTVDEHDGETCQRVKIGEHTVEKVEPVYEIICPNGDAV